ncbi:MULTISPECIES: tRNA uridine-5-carboxymethylaminomethyl(34) synthesis GTPase MnmE [Rhodopseudomonas]|uniref:tRNA modification GTPase MnmE n=1 Tax=Rhodopseudomonas palustris TaxID=1076 RepID=A0A0D7E0R7_RHOPL|nr:MULTISPECIES: tRNA uridine-5-carboxymethylaminomethyl(34) synthesis GTPase MnmE [Rhodopseudomonas]KIZ34398.1 tRNA modification GTPase MnmE [Rhodopseudomonas palustris]MDF3808755.1 tRNA uridine-5-carboxymethylaminomethyl(34) synthesis GTPase MnmE [Rhodopseudomonas sp. BAL398]WOK16458.1 tRNA uridine-5-carboxymethylaminomethyl(34) synthesis GTPase MnmE [Rhodopseudomonas sp. BAL398]
MHPRDHTIFALATGRPPTAIAIVRVSGPRAGCVLRTLSGHMPPPRVAARALLRDHNQELIDDGLVLWFPEPASATGEDVAEFHIHGGRAVLAALFAALASFDQVRPAEPGEFTRRGFENGKLDLTQAEGLDDLIHADTDRQRRQALRQLKGLLGDRARSWREQIIEASALIEAGIDFSDEGDVSAELMAPALARIATLRDEIEEVLAAQGQSERLRDGLVVAIAGPPNVGKSTLINQLARREVAIVSPQAGTTRDIIEVQLDLGGYPVTVIDTAGIRDSDDVVEQEGVRRAKARAAEADLVLWLSADDASGMTIEGQAPVWRVRNKIDLEGGKSGDLGPENLAAKLWQAGGGSAQERDAAVSVYRISARDGEGVPALVAGLERFAEAFFGGAEGGLIGRERHRLLLRDAAASLQRSMAGGIGEEMVAEELRVAAAALGRLLGRVDVEDVLGAIFSRFCVGK